MSRFRLDGFWFWLGYPRQNLSYVLSNIPTERSNSSLGKDIQTKQIICHILTCSYLCSDESFVKPYLSLVGHFEPLETAPFQSPQAIQPQYLGNHRTRISGKWAMLHCKCRYHRNPYTSIYTIAWVVKDLQPEFYSVIYPMN